MEYKRMNDEYISFMDDLGAGKVLSGRGNVNSLLDSQPQQQPQQQGYYGYGQQPQQGYYGYGQPQAYGQPQGYDSRKPTVSHRAMDSGLSKDTATRHVSVC